MLAFSLFEIYISLNKILNLESLLDFVAHQCKVLENVKSQSKKIVMVQKEAKVDG